jgi:O-acetyl-ADP-ribose deacetylase (regulator of RNase III)
VNHALHALRAFAQKEKLGSIALPRLACGINGLDWHDVRPLIDKHLGDLGIPIYIYANYQRGIKTIEPPK